MTKKEFLKELNKELKNPDAWEFKQYIVKHQATGIYFFRDNGNLCASGGPVIGKVSLLQRWLFKMRFRRRQKELEKQKRCSKVNDFFLNFEGFCEFDEG